VTPRSEKTITMFLAKSNVGHKVCRPDDVVINTLWAWMAALGVTKHAGIVSPAYGVYGPLTASGLLPQFADQLLRTTRYAAEYLRRSTGVNSSRMRLYPEQFLRIPLVCPPPSEQAAIARFLDWANGRLERAIRAKRRVIALLNEQKQAIIYRAVTRGLDPSVPLKPSGVPWLGDTPQHWEVRRLKSLCRFVTSGSRGWARYYADAGSVFLRIGNISTTSVELRLKRITYVTPPADAEGERTRALPDDLLLSITAQIGAVGIVPKGLGEAFVNQHTALIRLSTLFRNYDDVFRLYSAGLRWYALDRCEPARVPRSSPFTIRLTREERAALEQRAAKYTSAYRDVVRAKIILLAADGLRNDIIASRLSLQRQIVSKWRKRFFYQRVAGLDEEPRGGRTARFSPQRRR
jgi:restriction endonuclease S subunit